MKIKRDKRNCPSIQAVGIGEKKEIKKNRTAETNATNKIRDPKYKLNMAANFKLRTQIS